MNSARAVVKILGFVRLLAQPPPERPTVLVYNAVIAMLSITHIFGVHKKCNDIIMAKLKDIVSISDNIAESENL